MTEPSTPTQNAKLRANTAQIRKGITEAGFTITPDIHPITTI